ncbi:MAG: DUF6161 domain-containing protein [Hyphomicrobium sp.]|nr:DUF6161 domain-containing protein [Hyphomicrobium sp.]
MDRYGVEGRKEIAGLRAEREQANTDRQAWTEKASAEWKEMLDRVKTEVAASIEGISNTENAFKEQMKLRSSVRYWRDKAKEHRNRAHLQKFYIGAYAVVVAVIAYMVLPGFFAFVKTTAIELGEGSSTPLLILTGAGILAASIALWIARMLVRVYLEERHRALDADERAVMAETYCALTHEALVSETERVLVLSSLFRPSGEGTNKEDGPDTMQHAILAKLLDGKAAKV